MIESPDHPTDRLSRLDRMDIHREQVSLLFRGFGLSLLVTALNTGILSLVVWPVGDASRILIWASLVALVTLLRGGLYAAFHALDGARLDSRQWRTLFIGGTLLAGVAWGSASALVYPSQGIEYQVFVAFVIGGMAAGAVATLSVSWCASLSFLLPTLAPLALRLLSSEEPITRIMGAIVIVFGAMLLLSAHRIHRNIAENIAARIEKTDREQVLRRSQSFLAQTGQLANVGGWELDAESEQLRWTEQTFRILGVKDAIMPNSSEALHLFAPEVRPRIAQAVRQGLRNGSSFDMELPLAASDGSQRWIRALGRAVIDGKHVVGLQGAVQEITATKQLTADLEKSKRALERLHEITSTPDLAFANRVAAMLKLGCEVFDLPLGIVSRVEDDVYRIEYIQAPEGGPGAGTRFDLGDTYCVHTLRANGPLGIHHAGQSAIADHPCYRKFALEAYLGCPILVDGQRYGTLNFSSADHREPFTDNELSLIRLLAQWVGTELARQRNVRELDRFKHVLDNTLDMIFMFEPGSLRFVYLSDGAVSSLGYSREELLTMRPFDIKPELSESAFRDMIAPLLSGEMSSLSFETVHRRKDGAELPVEIFLQLVREPSSDGLFVAIVRDIGERQRVEREREREHRLLDIISRAQSRFIRDADTHVLFDGLLADLLSVTDSEYGFIGEVLHQGDGTPYLKTRAITNIAWNEETRRFYDENAPSGLEFRNLDTLFGAVLGTGEPVIANTPAADHRSGGLPQGHPPLRAFLGVPFYVAGRMVGMAGIANRHAGYDHALIDFLQPLLATCGQIIEASRGDERRRAAEAAVEEGAKRMRAILETAVDGIITFNADGIIESFNPAAEALFGYVADDAIDAPVGLLLAQDPEASGPGQWVGVGREAVGRRNDGSLFPLELSVSELELDGRSLYTAILRDITERKKVERLKDEFVSTVSHELRTPLTSIRGSLGLLAGGTVGRLSVRSRELVEIAHSNSDRLILLINDLLDMDKIASGKLEFDLAPQSLMPIVEEAIQANRPYGDQYGVAFELSGSVDQIVVNVDRGRCLQVLSNLLSNAAKFSPRGSTVELQVSVAATVVRVEVRDRGPGIPEAFRGRIFRKFSQADSSDTRRRGGTGLGLAISKNLIERMGGRIGFETIEGNGATFYFELPVAATEPDHGSVPSVHLAAGG